MTKSNFYYMILIFSIPFNFIVIKSGANLYFSTLIITIIYIFFIVDMPKDKFHIYVIGILAFLLLINFPYIIFSENFNNKLFLIDSVKYFQLFAVLSIAYYVAEYIKFDYIMKFIIIAIFIVSLRYIIENINILFLFSTLRGERPNPEFVGSFNNFAILIGIAILITFNLIKNIYVKYLFLLYWIIILITTLSRGTVVSLLLTALFFLVIKNSLKLYMKIIIFFITSLLLLSFILEWLGFLDTIIILFENRYLSFLGDKTIDEYGSGRIQILVDIYYKHILNSNIIELLLGHGFGSIHFMINGEFEYHTTHNNFIDI